MNLEQFAALKAGDKIVNPAAGNSRGEVKRTDARGVTVVWGPRSDREREFQFTAMSTAWFSWEKVDDERNDTQ